MPPSKIGGELTRRLCCGKLHAASSAGRILDDPHNIIRESLVLDLVGNATLPPELSAFNCCGIIQEERYNLLIADILGTVCTDEYAKAELVQYLGPAGRDLEHSLMAHDSVLEPIVSNLADVLNGDVLGAATGDVNGAGVGEETAAKWHTSTNEEMIAPLNLRLTEATEKLGRLRFCVSRISRDAILELISKHYGVNDNSYVICNTNDCETAGLLRHWMTGNNTEVQCVLKSYKMSGGGGGYAEMAKHATNFQRPYDGLPPLIPIPKQEVPINDDKDMETYISTLDEEKRLELLKRLLLCEQTFIRLQSLDETKKIVPGFDLFQKNVSKPKPTVSSSSSSSSSSAMGKGKGARKGKGQGKGKGTGTGKGKEPQDDDVDYCDVLLKTLSLPSVEHLFDVAMHQMDFVNPPPEGTNEQDLEISRKISQALILKIATRVQEEMKEGCAALNIFGGKGPKSTFSSAFTARDEYGERFDVDKVLEKCMSQQEGTFPMMTALTTAMMVTDTILKQLNEQGIETLLFGKGVLSSPRATQGSDEKGEGEEGKGKGEGDEEEEENENEEEEEDTLSHDISSMFSPKAPIIVQVNTSGFTSSDFKRRRFRDDSKNQARDKLEGKLFARLAKLRLQRAIQISMAIHKRWQGQGATDITAMLTLMAHLSGMSEQCHDFYSQLGIIASRQTSVHCAKIECNNTLVTLKEVFGKIIDSCDLMQASILLSDNYNPKRYAGLHRMRADPSEKVDYSQFLTGYTMLFRAVDCPHPSVCLDPDWPFGQADAKEVRMSYDPPSIGYFDLYR